MEALGQGGRRGRRRVQAEDAAAAGAAEMQVASVLDIGLGRTEPENAACIGGLVGQADIGQPVKDAVERHTVDAGQCIATQRTLDVAVTERPRSRLEQRKHPDAGAGDARPGRPDGGFDGGERSIGMAFHTEI